MKPAYVVMLVTWVGIAALNGADVAAGRANGWLVGACILGGWLFGWAAGKGDR